MERKFTAIIEQEKGFYIGYIEEIPGVNTQGTTLEEVRTNLREALELILQTKKELIEKELVGKDFIRERRSVDI
ncbi:MAG: type II toxin-antitoxin system HicB family antitoxin [Candidatus Helarchaeota archaeon]